MEKYCEIFAKNINLKLIYKSFVTHTEVCSVDLLEKFCIITTRKLPTVQLRYCTKNTVLKFLFNLND